MLVLYQADFFGAHTLTFIQKRPIGLGIKNNLGSLYRYFALFCCHFLDTLYIYVRRLFNELFAKFYYKFDFRTSCSWRSLLSNFPENWKNMLLNARFFTYIRLEFCYSFQWKITRSEPLLFSSTCCSFLLLCWIKTLCVFLLQLY